MNDEKQTKNELSIQDAKGKDNITRHTEKPAPIPYMHSKSIESHDKNDPIVRKTFSHQ